MNTDGVGDADDVDDGFPYNFFSSFSSVSPIQISLSSLCMSCVCVCDGSGCVLWCVCVLDSEYCMRLFWFCFRFAGINVKVVALGQMRASTLCVFWFSVHAMTAAAAAA